MVKKKASSKAKHHAAQSAASQPVQDAHRRVLAQLEPLLKTLSADELTTLAVADIDEILRPRRFFRRNIAYPIEAVRVRVNKTVVGVLLLRRRWLETAFQTNCNEDIQRRTHWQSVLEAGCREWLYQLEAVTGRWLLAQAELLPDQLGLDTEGGESILDILEESSPEKIDRLLWVPDVVRELQLAMRRGKLNRRKRVKMILRKWSAGKPGAPTKSLSERQDVLITDQVDAAEKHLAQGHDVRRSMRKAGGYKSGGDVIARELRRMGYLDDEVAAIIRARILRGAAQRLVAKRTGRKLQVIRSMMSRAKRQTDS